MACINSSRKTPSLGARLGPLWKTKGRVVVLQPQVVVVFQQHLCKRSAGQRHIVEASMILYMWVGTLLPAEALLQVQGICSGGCCVL